MEQLVPVDVNFYAIAPLLTLAVATIVTLVVDLVMPKSSARTWLFTASLGGLVVALYYVAALWTHLPAATAVEAFTSAVPDALQRISHGIAVFGGAYIVDRFTLVFTAVTILSAAGAILMSGLRDDEDLSGYLALILGGALGMAVVVGAGHLLVMFLGLEILSLNLYVAVAFRPGHVSSKEAALKYLILGSVASAVLLYGFAFLYGQTGSMVLAELAAGWAAPSTVFMKVGLGLSLVAIAFKLAMAPFHAWAPDVYEGAPSPITGFMAIGTKAAAFGMLVRLFVALLPPDNPEMTAALMVPLWAAGVLSMIIGSFGAVAQFNLKRLLAYSGVAHAGYITMALLGMTTSGVGVGAFYLVAYMMATIGVFSIISWLSAKGRDVETIDDMKGLFYSHPMLAALMTLFLLSMAGFPPAAGFPAKLFLILSAFNSGVGTAAWWLVGALTATAGVSAFAYIKVVAAMFRREQAVAVEAPVADTDDSSDDHEDRPLDDSDEDEVDAIGDRIRRQLGLDEVVISGAGGPAGDVVDGTGEEAFVAEAVAVAEDAPSREITTAHESLPFSWPIAIAVTLAAVGTIYFGLFPRVLLDLVTGLLPLS